MKNALIHIFTLLVSVATFAQNGFLVLNPNNDSEVKLPNFKVSKVKLNNKSKATVTVLEEYKGEVVSSFGLSGKTVVYVEQGNSLYLKNNENKVARVKIAIRKAQNKNAETSNEANESISFKLINNTTKSIPLIIPGVMNPNLSPMSSSGVDLNVGQKIFFKIKGKKYLLLEVNETIKNGDEIKVGKLIKARKKALNLIKQ